MDYYFDEERFLERRIPGFECDIEDCNETFTTIQEYESHYNVEHKFTCSYCQKRCVSNYLLDIHLLECHDTLFQILAIKKKNSFSCLLESCKERFSSAEERKQHFISEHKNFTEYLDSIQYHNEFTEIKSSNKEDEDNSPLYPIEKIQLPSKRKFEENNLKGNNTINQSKSRKKAEDSYPVRCFENNSESSGRKFLCKIPETLSFGEKVPKGFTGREWYQVYKDNRENTTVNVEEMDFSDIISELNNV